MVRRRRGGDSNHRYMVDEGREGIPLGAAVPVGELVVGAVVEPEVGSCHGYNPLGAR